MSFLANKDYKHQIQKDFDELSIYYPFSSLFFPKESSYFKAGVRVIAVCSDIIEAVNGKEEDFTKEYSKLIYIFASNNYQNEGCIVYGCKWIDFSILHEEDCHFNSKERTPFGYELCVGVPESFCLYRNVILECVKTAENMLIAYEQLMKGEQNRLNICSYAHGFLGRHEFVKSIGLNYKKEIMKDGSTDR